MPVRLVRGGMLLAAAGSLTGCTLHHIDYVVERDLFLSQDSIGFSVSRARSRVIEWADGGTATTLGAQLEYYMSPRPASAEGARLRPQFTQDAIRLTNPRSDYAKPVETILDVASRRFLSVGEAYRIAKGSDGDIPSAIWIMRGRYGYAYADVVSQTIRYQPFGGAACTMRLPVQSVDVDKGIAWARDSLQLSNDGRYLAALTQHQVGQWSVALYEGCRHMGSYVLTPPPGVEAELVAEMKRVFPPGHYIVKNYVPFRELSGVCVADGHAWFTFTERSSQSNLALREDSHVRLSRPEKPSKRPTREFAGDPYNTSQRPPPLTLFDCERQVFVWVEHSYLYDHKDDFFMHEYDPRTESVTVFPLRLGGRL